MGGRKIGLSLIVRSRRSCSISKEQLLTGCRKHSQDIVVDVRHVSFTGSFRRCTGSASSASSLKAAVTGNVTRSRKAVQDVGQADPADGAAEGQTSCLPSTARGDEHRRGANSCDDLCAQPIWCWAHVIDAERIGPAIWHRMSAGPGRRIAGCARSGGGRMSNIGSVRGATARSAANSAPPRGGPREGSASFVVKRGGIGRQTWVRLQCRPTTMSNSQVSERGARAESINLKNANNTIGSATKPR